MTMPRLVRIALVLAGLATAGAALGAMAAGGALASSYALRGLWEPYFYGDAAAAAWLGGALGVVLGPACALGFLRRVPLWLALVGPTAATYVGGVLGEFWYVGMLTAPLAFVLAVVVLHRSGTGRTDAAKPRDAAESRPQLSAGPGRGSGRMDSRHAARRAASSPTWRGA